MHCEGCVRRITDQVAAVPGVEDVDVALDDLRVTVRGEELAEQVVRDAILLAGYDARLVG
jgi:copper chaperone CopZ